jgi:hypothetical protein
MGISQNWRTSAMKTSAILCASSLLSLTGGEAHATLSQYANASSWVTFADDVSAVVLPNASKYLGTGSAAAGVYSGVKFSQDDSFGPAYLFTLGDGVSGQVSSQMQNKVGTANIFIDFGREVNGFSLNYGTVTYSNYSTSPLEVIGGVPAVDVELSNGDVLLAPGASIGTYAFNIPGYLGIMDSKPFSSVLLSVTYVSKATDVTALSIGRIAYSVSTVPDPSAMWSCLSGLGVLGVVWKRRQNAAA